MLESFLVDGRQDHEQGKPLIYGQSITDTCLSWERTVPLLERWPSCARRRGTPGARGDQD